MEPIYLTICQKETGKRIRELLKQNGYSVRDIQEAMGFENPQAVYKWTSGKSLPSIDNLLILSRLLHTDIESILVVDGDDAVFWTLFPAFRLCFDSFRSAPPLSDPICRPKGFPLPARRADGEKSGETAESEKSVGTCDGEDENTCRTAEAQNQNRIPFPDTKDGKSGGKQNDAARPEDSGQRSRTVRYFRKYGGKQNGKTCRSDQCHHSRTQPCQNAADGRSAPVSAVDNSQNRDENTGRQDTSRCRGDSAGQTGDTDSDKSSGVDGYRSRRHFGDRDEIGKFVHGKPAALLDDLTLNDRDGGISAADAEQAHLQKAPE